MITGRLSDVPHQRALLHPALLRAFDALAALDLARAAPGRVELDSERLFYMIQDTELRRIENSQAEAHAQYADIQIPVSTVERFGFSVPQDGLALIDDQLEARDLAFYADPANEFFMNVAPGCFAVFFPGELHRPCLAVDAPQPIRKVVVKVHASLLGL